MRSLQDNTMKKECVFCHYNPKEDEPQECGRAVWSEYIKFGNRQRYKMFTEKELTFNIYL